MMVLCVQRYVALLDAGHQPGAVPYFQSIVRTAAFALRKRVEIVAAGDVMRKSDPAGDVEGIDAIVPQGATRSEREHEG